MRVFSADGTRANLDKRAGMYVHRRQDTLEKLL